MLPPSFPPSLSFALVDSFPPPVISMQSSLHLILQTEAHARRCFSTIASFLRLGGTFHATTMDARVLVELLGSQSHYNQEGHMYVARHVDEEGRHLCSLEVEKDTYEMIFRRDPGKPCPLYGLKYYFHWGQEEVRVRESAWLCGESCMARLELMGGWWLRWCGWPWGDRKEVVKVVVV